MVRCPPKLPSCLSLFIKKKYIPGTNYSEFSSSSSSTSAHCSHTHSWHSKPHPSALAKLPIVSLQYKPTAEYPLRPQHHCHAICVMQYVSCAQESPIFARFALSVVSCCKDEHLILLSFSLYLCFEFLVAGDEK